MNFKGVVLSIKQYRQEKGNWRVGFSLISHIVKGAGTAVSDLCLDLEGKIIHIQFLNKHRLVFLRD